jgi:conjugative transfer signal peptidase TraF
MVSLHTIKKFLLRNNRGLRPALISAVGIPLVAWGLIGAWELLRDAGYEINVSSSMPIGVYRRLQERPQRGSVVAVCLPDAVALFAQTRGYVARGECQNGSKPLLKKIAAMAGDTVRVEVQGVFINGELLPHSVVLERDSQGRELEVVMGAYTLRGGELWVMSTYDRRSYDSRYFGVVTERNILATAYGVMVFGGR